MGNVIPHAKSPDLRSAYKALVRYLEHHGSQLTPDQIEAGVESKRRLRRLESDANRLVRINNALLDEESLKLTFDEGSDTITFSFKGTSQSIKLNRAHPDVPIKFGGATAVGAYVAGASDRDTPATDELKSLMEQMLEGVYNNAFRLTKLVAQITGRSKYHCENVTIVRNKLVEHPNPGALYSFGFSSNGPVVKPIYRGPRDWVDAGLVPNLQALSESLVQVLRDDA
jgi:hypothetical protein